MGKDEQPHWIRRNQLGVLMVALGLVIIAAVAVPLAVIAARQSHNRLPEEGNDLGAAQETSYNQTINGTWSDSTDSNPQNGGNSSFQKQCFASIEELQSAVDTYLSFAYDSSSANGEQDQVILRQMRTVASTYGWPMNNWCTSRLTNLSSLFSASRNPLSFFFNEDIASWDVRRVQDFSRAFEGCSRFNRDLSRWRVGARLGEGGRGRRMQQQEQSLLPLRLDDMFLNASIYNYSLCAWGRRLSISSANLTISADRTFQGTACLDPQDPDFNSVPPSPLCAACGEMRRSRW
jgi:hypothetical protein